MISFHCPNCTTFYTIENDKAGKRTICPKCKQRMTVPDHEAEPELEPELRVEPARVRPPAKVVVLLILAAVAFLAAVVFILYLLTPNPSKDTVERSLREHLPPGYEKFQMVSYERDKGELKFEVVYHEHGDLIGVHYEITRFYSTIEAFGEVGWRVQVIGRKSLLDRPFEKWLMVEASFNRQGKMVWKGAVTAAGPEEGPRFEERARRIAVAVAACF